MNSGRTAEARRLVESELAGGSEQARLLEAVLTVSGDSAAVRLEKIAREGGHGQASAQAAERMGDVLFFALRWADAVKWWEYSASLAADPGDRQRLAIKSARAEFAAGRDKQAQDKLKGVAKSAATPLAGEARFWSGAVLERQGKIRDAAEEYLAAYSSPGNRLGLAALQRLHSFYGSSGGKNAEDWRERWSRASSGTVFESRYLPPVAEPAVQSPEPATRPAAGWVIQLGAFSTRQRAADHAARIVRLGLKPVIDPPAADKLYRVRIEGVSSQKELNRITALLKKNKFDFHVIQP